MRPPLYSFTRFALPLVGLSFASSVYCQTSVQPDGLAFPVSQLSGWWAESYSSTPACDSANVRTKQIFSKDGKRLRFVFDRPWETDFGVTDGIDATILSATDRTLIIRYDKETRLNQNGQPVEWELSIAAPGVYRWRETEWKPGQVNSVVGIRCTER